MFADATTSAAKAARRLWVQIERAGSPRADSVARRIVLGLPAQPVVSADSAAARYDVTATAARAGLNRLEETGVLVPTRVGRRRDREWISDELFQLLDAFEHDLGQPFVPRAVIADAAGRAPRIDADRFRSDVDAIVDQDPDG